MTQYILKDGHLDGIYDGIGVVRTGEPITPRNEVHEAALKAHEAFRQYRASKDPKDAPLTAEATVETVEADATAPAPKKTAKSGDKE